MLTDISSCRNNKGGLLCDQYVLLDGNGPNCVHSDLSTMKGEQLVPAESLYKHAVVLVCCWRHALMSGMSTAAASSSSLLRLAWRTEMQNA